MKTWFHLPIQPRSLDKVGLASKTRMRKEEKWFCEDGRDVQVTGCGNGDEGRTLKNMAYSRRGIISNILEGCHRTEGMLLITPATDAEGNRWWTVRDVVDMHNCKMAGKRNVQIVITGMLEGKAKYPAGWLGNKLKRWEMHLEDGPSLDTLEDRARA